MNFDKLTDAELIQLLTLEHEEEIYQRRQSLLFFDEDKNPNYSILTKTRSELKYIDGKLVDGCYSGVVLEGSSRCFDGSQLVVTKNGAKEIKQVNSQDEVLTYNELTGENEYKRVVSSMKFKNNQKKCIKITLKTGETIHCTEDHEFYYEGAWVSIKHVVSLWNDKNSNKH
jgi:intein/homing endonuclease